MPPSGVFVDSGYWIARLNPRDQLHRSAITAAESLGDAHWVTSQMVLVEVLTFFGGAGPGWRQAAAALCRELEERTSIEVVRQTPGLFDKALEEYRSRPDKAWSAVDCASIVLMRERGIMDVLAADHHFEQAGFRLLMQRP